MTRMTRAPPSSTRGRPFGSPQSASTPLAQPFAGELGQGHAQVVALTGAYHNLLRMWIEV